ncbi:hypothetical protein ACSZNB_11570 [Aeromonas hydrophila]
MPYPIEQLAQDLRGVFERHLDRLDEIHFPFAAMFPENCCQGTSVMLGMLVQLIHPSSQVVIIQGTTRGPAPYSHYLLKIDGRVYDLTLDQFQSTLGNKFDQLRRPLFSSAKHPLRMHFFHKKRVSTIDAYLDFCDQYTGAENGLKILQFLAKKLTQEIDI